MTMTSRWYRYLAVTCEWLSGSRFSSHIRVEWRCLCCSVYRLTSTRVARSFPIGKEDWVTLRDLPRSALRLNGLEILTQVRNECTQTTHLIPSPLAILCLTIPSLPDVNLPAEKTFCQCPWWRVDGKTKQREDGVFECCWLALLVSRLIIKSDIKQRDEMDGIIRLTLPRMQGTNVDHSLHICRFELFQRFMYHSTKNSYVYVQCTGRIIRKIQRSAINRRALLVM